jgi:hypothetical protein
MRASARFYLLDIEREDGLVNSLMAASNTTLIKCPTCGEIWVPMQERGEAWDSPVKDFLRKMRFLKQLENKLGYAIALEIKDEKKP